MEEGPCAYRAPDSVSSCPEAANLFESQILLGNEKMSGGSPEKLPCMGIQARSFLLVYQRHDLSWKRTIQLAEKDENVPAV